MNSKNDVWYVEKILNFKIDKKRKNFVIEKSDEYFKYKIKWINNAKTISHSRDVITLTWIMRFTLLRIIIIDIRMKQNNTRTSNDYWIENFQN